MRTAMGLVVVVLSVGCNCGSVPPAVEDAGLGGGSSAGGQAGGASGGGQAGGAQTGGGQAGGLQTGGGQAGGSAPRTAIETASAVGRLQAGGVTLDVQVGGPVSPRRATAGTVSFELVSPISP